MCSSRRVNCHVWGIHTWNPARAGVPSLGSGINVSLPPPEQMSMIIWAHFSNLLFTSERRWNSFLLAAGTVDSVGQGNLAARHPPCLNRWDLPASISKVYLKHTGAGKKTPQKSTQTGLHRKWNGKLPFWLQNQISHIFPWDGEGV